MTEDQATFYDLANRVARSCVAVVDTVVTRGGFKGEELTTIGQLRDQAIQVVALYEKLAKEHAESSPQRKRLSKPFGAVGYILFHREHFIMIHPPPRFMKLYDPLIAKETTIHVALGTVINYPLNIFYTWLAVVKWGITDPLMLSTILTVGISFVAFTRIYIVRTLTERRKAKMQ